MDTKPHHSVPKPTLASSGPPVSCWSLALTAPSQKPESKDTSHALHTDGPPGARGEERADRGQWDHRGHTPLPTSHTPSRQISFPQILPIQCFPPPGAFITCSILHLLSPFLHVENLGGPPECHFVHDTFPPTSPKSNLSVLWITKVSLVKIL